MFTEGLTEGHIAAPTITDGAYRRFRFWVSRSLEATVAIAAGGAASGIPESDALLDKAKAKAPHVVLSASTTWVSPPPSLRTTQPA